MSAATVAIGPASPIDSGFGACRDDDAGPRALTRTRHAASRAASWVPRYRLVALALLAGLPLWLAGADDLRARGTAALLLGALLAATGAEAALLWRVGRELEVTRSHEPRLSIGEANPVWLDVRSRAPIGLTGEIADDPPAGFLPLDPHGPIALAPRGRARLRYEAHPHARGDHAFGSAWLRVSTVLGLASIRLEVPLASVVPVYPNLRALARYRVEARHRVSLAGRHALRGAGRGGEFDRLRDYGPGDDYRQVDWKASARRDAPVVKVHRPERGQHVLLVVDSGRAMAPRLAADRRSAHHTGERLVDASLVTRHDLALSSALLLAEVALGQGDAVGLALYSHGIHASCPARRTRAALPRMLTQLYAAQASHTGSDHTGFARWAAATLRRRSLVAVWTDLDPLDAAPLLAAIRLLQVRHQVLVLALTDDDAEDLARSEPADERACYARAVAADYVAQRAAGVKRLRDAGAWVVETPPGAMGLAAVDAYVAIKLRGLL